MWYYHLLYEFIQLLWRNHRYYCFPSILKVRLTSCEVKKNERKRERSSKKILSFQPKPLNFNWYENCESGVLFFLRIQRAYTRLGVQVCENENGDCHYESIFLGVLEFPPFFYAYLEDERVFFFSIFRVHLVQPEIVQIFQKQAKQITQKMSYTSTIQQNQKHTRTFYSNVFFSRISLLASIFSRNNNFA